MQVVDFTQLSERTFNVRGATRNYRAAPNVKVRKILVDMLWRGSGLVYRYMGLQRFHDSRGLSRSF